MSHHDEPNWEDVRWDHRASDEATAALGRAAAEIEQLLAEEAHRAAYELPEWQGAAFESFRQRRTALREELHDLAAACRAAAEEVRRAAARAREEQARREREREAWEEEQRRRRALYG
jgi:uncharacterized protein YukE